MPAPPAEIAPLIAAGQVLRSWVEAWVEMPSGVTHPVMVASMSGSLDMDRIHRREASAVILGEDGGPLPVEATRRNGQSLIARKVVLSPGGRRHEAPLGVFRVTRMGSAGGHAWTLTGRSWEFVLGRAGFFATREILPMTAVAAVKMLVAEIFPDVPVAVLPGVRDETCSGRTYEPGQDSRWKAIEDYSLLAGAQLWCPPGGGFMLGLVPSTDDPPAWEISESTALVSHAADWDEDRTGNAVRVEDRETGAVGLAADMQPGSSTYVGDAGLLQIRGLRGGSGSEGYRLLPEFIDLQADNPTTARLAARTRLQQLQNRARGVTFTHLDNPWLDVGDVVQVTHPTGDSRHVITGLPLSGTESGSVTPETSG